MQTPTIPQAVNRMNSAHVRLILEVAKHGSPKIDPSISLGDARGLATAFATLKRWGAVEQSGSETVGLRRVFSYRLTDFGAQLGAAFVRKFGGPAGASL